MRRYSITTIYLSLLICANGVFAEDSDFKAEPGDAVLNVTSQPTGAYLTINDLFIGNTPLAGIPLLPGTYLLTAEYPDYVKGEIRVALTENSIEDIDFRLSKGRDSSSWWSTRDFWIGVGAGAAILAMVLFIP